MFHVSVPSRDMQTLAAAIVDNVIPGTGIVSDSWRDYNAVSRHGFQHDSVNHSLNFVSPEDPKVNTQKVERMGGP